MVELYLVVGPVGEAVGGAGAHGVLRCEQNSGERGFFGRVHVLVVMG